MRRDRHTLAKMYALHPTILDGWQSFPYQVREGLPVTRAQSEAWSAASKSWALAAFTLADQLTPNPWSVSEICRRSHTEW